MKNSYQFFIQQTAKIPYAVASIAAFCLILSAAIFFPNASAYAQCTPAIIPTTSTDNARAQISGNTVVWAGVAGGVRHIFKYDGTTTTQLSTTSIQNTNPQIDGNTVVWVGNDGTTDQIYKHDGTTLTLLSTTSTDNANPQISGNTVVWLGKIGGVSHIFKHDGTTLTQLSRLLPLTTAHK